MEKSVTLQTVTDTASEAFGVLLYALRAAKPEERGELARRFQIAITDLEKVAAYFQVYIRDYVASGGK